MFNDFTHLPSTGSDWQLFRGRSQNLQQASHPSGAELTPLIEVAYGFLTFEVLPQIKNLDASEINIDFKGCVEDSAFIFEFEANGYIIRIDTFMGLRVLLVINPAINDVVFDINLYEKGNQLSN